MVRINDTFGSSSSIRGTETYVQPAILGAQRNPCNNFVRPPESAFIISHSGCENERGGGGGTDQGERSNHNLT